MAGSKQQQMLLPATGPIAKATSTVLPTSSSSSSPLSGRKPPPPQQQQQLRHKLLEFVQRVVGNSDRHSLESTRSSDADPIQATDKSSSSNSSSSSSSNSSSSDDSESDAAGMAVHARVHHAHGARHAIAAAASCDAHVLELKDRPLDSGGGVRVAHSNMNSTAQTQLHTLASELAALHMRVGGAAWHADDEDDDDDDSSSDNDGDDDDMTLASSSSSSSDTETLRVAVVVDAAIQRRASAGHAVAQRFVAAHELAAQAQTFVRTGEHARALESMRRAVVLWRSVAVAPRLLNALLQLANDCVAAAGATAHESADPCFVFAIGEDSASPVELSSSDTSSSNDRHKSTAAASAVDHVVVWRQCVAAFPRVAVFHFWLAQRLFDSGRVDDARVAVDRALALELNPQWLYLRAQCLATLPTTSLTHRIDAFQQFVAANPPDEANVPEAYYTLALLHLEQRAYALAKQYQALAQLAERPPVRFPTRGLVADDFRPKRLVRVAFSAPLLVLSFAQQRTCIATSERACECCGESLPLLTLLKHKMKSCKQQLVGCLLCGASMAPELLLLHQERMHSPT